MPYTQYYEKSKMFHGSLLHVMGTGLDALLMGKDKSFLLSVWEQIELKIWKLHRMLNRFDPSSEISKVNLEAAVHPVRVSGELWDILVDAKQYHTYTFGYFDITLDDYNKVQLDADHQTVSFADKSVSLDLGGYAKGYALKKIQDIIRTSGIRQALINLGNSSVLAVGTHPMGNSWNIGVENPFCPNQPLHSFELHNNALSTSGNTSRHTNHIKNPHLGTFVSERKIVSVVADDSLDAEVLTTALMVADPQSAKLIKETFKDAASYVFHL